MSEPARLFKRPGDRATDDDTLFANPLDDKGECLNLDYVSVWGPWLSGKWKMKTGNVEVKVLPSRVAAFRRPLRKLFLFGPSLPRMPFGRFLSVGFFALGFGCPFPAPLVILLHSRLYNSAKWRKTVTWKLRAGDRTRLEEISTLKYWTLVSKISWLWVSCHLFLNDAPLVRSMEYMKRWKWILKLTTNCELEC